MMQTAEMLKVFARHRGDAIVIPGRGGKHWVNISTQPNRDLPMGDPAMGGHAMFGLGVAMARPQVPNAKNVKYDQLALASGYPHAYSFANLEEFTGAIGDIMSQPGPVFVAMKVMPEVINEAIGRRPRWQTRSRTQVIEDLRKELGIAD